VDSINKKNKNAKVKDFMVKNHISVFVNCQIENPAFDSQVRGCMSRSVTASIGYYTIRSMQHVECICIG
jgi:DNA topoisomerase-2